MPKSNPEELADGFRQVEAAGTRGRAALDTLAAATRPPLTEADVTRLIDERLAHHRVVVSCPRCRSHLRRNDVGAPLPCEVCDAERRARTR